MNNHLNSQVIDLEKDALGETVDLYNSMPYNSPSFNRHIKVQKTND